MDQHNRREFLRAAVATPLVGMAGTEPGRAVTMQERNGERLVGTHYYPWWGKPTHWENGYFGDPILGEYSSRDSDTIQQHIDWLTNYDISWLSLSWWGIDSWEDVTIRDHLLAHEAISEVDVSILYEPAGVLNWSDETNSIDFDQEDNREKFIDHMVHLDEKFFDHPSYLHFNDRPVLYLYIVKAFSGDFPGVLRALRTEYDIDPYLIGDVFHWFPPSRRNLPIARSMDAFTAYSMYDPNVDNINQDFLEKIRGYYREWSLAAKLDDVDFIPVVMPGKHDGQNPDEPVLERSLDRFEGYSKLALDFVDAPSNAVLITSFNEWHEGTQIEPGTDYGETYLEQVPETLTNSNLPLGSGSASYGFLKLVYSKTVEEYKLNSDISEERSRKLAFWCSEITLLDASGSQIISYDIGTPDKEPILLEGTSWSNQQPPTSRWFGGPTGQTVIGIEEEYLRNASKAEIVGQAAVDGMEMWIVNEGEETDSIPINRNGWTEYLVDLNSDKESTSSPTTSESDISTSTSFSTPTSQTSTKSPTPTQKQTEVTSTQTSTETTEATTPGFGILAVLLGTGEALRRSWKNEE